MRKLFLFTLCFMSVFSFVNAQTNEEDEHTTAFVYGINFNTNGGTIGGFNIKYSQVKKRNLYTTWGLEVVALKHPQEKKITYDGTNRFVFGKLNYLYSIRPTYGIDYLLFRKAPEESVQVMAHFSAGPSFGVELPYYIKWQRNVPQAPLIIEPYDPVKHSWTEIAGTGGLFAGIGEAKIIPALFIKAGISLEFGEFRNNLTGLEVGFTSELFSRTTRILATEAAVGGTKNKQYMLGAYMTIFLGSRK